MLKFHSGIFLGFDFGMRHIGYAIGQKASRTATPGGIIAARSGIPNWQLLDALIKEWQPEALIVGLPLNMDGSEQSITYHARTFAKNLEKHYHLPIHFMDERLTTKAAREQLFEQGGYKALTQDKVNSMSAQIILENWLQISV